MSNDYYLDPRLAEAYDADMGRDADAMDDVPFYVELAQQAAATAHPVLELGSGTGRVTIPIAQAGASIVGLDNSAAMLAVARRKSEAAGVEVDWIEADMRDFHLDQRCGLIIIPFRSFLHLLTDADQLACLVRVHEHLVPGGRCALNFFVPRLAGLSSQNRPAPVISRIYRSMRLRYVTREEMNALLTATGFEVEALYGGFDRQEFRPTSSEMVWLSRKA